MIERTKRPNRIRIIYRVFKCTQCDLTVLISTGIKGSKQFEDTLQDTVVSCPNCDADMKGE